MESVTKEEILRISEMFRKEHEKEVAVREMIRMQSRERLQMDANKRLEKRARELYQEALERAK